jgi:hypothetical protein
MTILVKGMMPSRELTTTTHSDEDSDLDQPNLDELPSLRFCK